MEKRSNTVHHIIYKQQSQKLIGLRPIYFRESMEKYMAWLLYNFTIDYRIKNLHKIHNFINFQVK